MTQTVQTSGIFRMASHVRMTTVTAALMIAALNADAIMKGTEVETTTANYVEGETVYTYEFSTDGIKVSKTGTEEPVTLTNEELFPDFNASTRVTQQAIWTKVEQM